MAAADLTHADAREEFEFQLKTKDGKTEAVTVTLPTALGKLLSDIQQRGHTQYSIPELQDALNCLDDPKTHVEPAGARARLGEHARSIIEYRSKGGATPSQEAARVPSPAGPALTPTVPINDNDFLKDTGPTEAKPSESLDDQTDQIFRKVQIGTALMWVPDLNPVWDTKVSHRHDL
jgi:hypothetical protein